MDKLISFLLIFCLVMSFSIRQKTEQEPMNPTEKHPVIAGLLLIGWGMYAGWMGYTLLTAEGKRYGDTELVGGCLLVASAVMTVWGFSLVF